MMPETMNLIDDVLGWEPGTLRNMNRVEWRGADWIPQQTATPGVTVVEFKRSLPDPNFAVDTRRMVIAHVAQLSEQQLAQLLNFIENNLGQGQSTETKAELDAMKAYFDQQLGNVLNQLNEIAGRLPS
jgi:hypothetical protein